MSECMLNMYRTYYDISFQFNFCNESTTEHQADFTQPFTQPFTQAVIAIINRPIRSRKSLHSVALITLKLASLLILLWFRSDQLLIRLVDTWMNHRITFCMEILRFNWHQCDQTRLLVALCSEELNLRVLKKKPLGERDVARDANNQLLQ